MREALAGGSSPVRVQADQDADVLAIPVAALLDVMGSSRLIARDVNALAEARRLAIRPLSRDPHAAARRHRPSSCRGTIQGILALPATLVH